MGRPCKEPLADVERRQVKAPFFAGSVVGRSLLLTYRKHMLSIQGPPEFSAPCREGETPTIDVPSRTTLRPQPLTDSLPRPQSPLRPRARHRTRQRSQPLHTTGPHGHREPVAGQLLQRLHPARLRRRRARLCRVLRIANPVRVAARCALPCAGLAPPPAGPGPVAEHPTPQARGPVLAAGASGR